MGASASKAPLPKRSAALRNLNPCCSTILPVVRKPFLRHISSFRKFLRPLLPHALKLRLFPGFANVFSESAIMPASKAGGVTKARKGIRWAAHKRSLKVCLCTSIAVPRRIIIGYLNRV